MNKDMLMEPKLFNGIPLVATTSSGNFKKKALVFSESALGSILVWKSGLTEKNFN